MEDEDEDETPLLILSGSLPRGSKTHLPDGQCFHDDDLGLWVFSYEGADKWLSKIKAKVCAACMAGDECDDSDFPDELDDFYGLDIEDEEDDALDEVFRKFSSFVDEFVKNLADHVEGGGAKTKAAAAVLGVTLPVTKDALDAAYKKAAFRNHPDRGGTTEKMAAVNAAREVLAAQL